MTCIYNFYIYLYTSQIYKIPSFFLLYTLEILRIHEPRNQIIHHFIAETVRDFHKIFPSFRVQIIKTFLIFQCFLSYYLLLLDYLAFLAFSAFSEVILDGFGSVLPQFFLFKVRSESD